MITFTIKGNNGMTYTVEGKGDASGRSWNLSATNSIGLTVELAKVAAAVGITERELRNHCHKRLNAAASRAANRVLNGWVREACAANPTLAAAFQR